MNEPQPTDMISTYFSWKEALYLPRWFRMGNAQDGLTDEVMANLTFLFKKMDAVRDFFERGIVVHCAWRPEAYNKIVGGAAGSAHMALDPNVAACDFHVSGVWCSDAQTKLMPKLDDLEMRMEDNGPQPGWIHLDTRPLIPGHSRFFKP